MTVPTQLPRMPSLRLDGRRAIVTGGSRGIGFGAATALAEVGAQVTIAARGETGVSDAVGRLTREGFRANGAVMDVSEINSVREFFQNSGPFEILVNSAGIARHAPVLETQDEDYDRVMAVNARAAFFLACEAAKGMVETGGSIIQISSQMGFVGGLERAVYCASKHAVEGMTKAMAVEFGPSNIRVNTVCPTFVGTELTKSTLSDPDKMEWIRSKIKLGRIAKVEDIMGAVVFLASDASAMITGTHILIDGGWTAG